MKNLTSFIATMAMVSAAFFLVISITISNQVSQYSPEYSQASPAHLIAHRASGRLEMLVAHRASGRIEIAHRASGRMEALV
jgi:hypothetical protein